MSAKFMTGDEVTIANDEGLDIPHEALGKTGVVTGYLYHEGKVVEYWVESLTHEFPKFNAASYHIELKTLPQYSVQYPSVRARGSGYPGPHRCSGCRRNFVRNEVFEIGSVRIANDVWIVVNVHCNEQCREAAIDDVRI